MLTHIIAQQDSTFPTVRPARLTLTDYGHVPLKRMSLETAMPSSLVAIGGRICFDSIVHTQTSARTIILKSDLFNVQTFAAFAGGGSLYAVAQQIWHSRDSDWTRD